MRPGDGGRGSRAAAGPRRGPGRARTGVVLLLALSLGGGCGDSGPTDLEPLLLGSLAAVPGAPELRVRIQGWDLLALEPEALWYRDYPPMALDRGVVDEDGVPLREVDGEFHYHPVKSAQRGLKFVDIYRRTGEEAYLEHAVRFAEKLLADAQIHGEAVYFVYPFDRELHRRASERIEAPWFSGMAQGQALSFFLRLEDTTGDPRWREAADRTFASFLRAKTPGVAAPTAYTVLVDEHGYYWVEEYPVARQNNRTLNGFIFGVMGLYEYWLETGNETSRRLVEASLTTLRAYLQAFRVPGEASLYCLEHRVQDRRYHEVHVEQLSELGRITSETYFRFMHDLFRADQPR